MSPLGPQPKIVLSAPLKEEIVAPPAADARLRRSGKSRVFVPVDTTTVATSTAS